MAAAAAAAPTKEVRISLLLLRKASTHVGGVSTTTPVVVMIPEDIYIHPPSLPCIAYLQQKEAASKEYRRKWKRR